MPINFNGTVINDYYPGVTVNGTPVTEVYFDGIQRWVRYPYPPGTNVFTFTYCPGSNLFDFTTTAAGYTPLVLSGTPYISSGNPSGYPDAILYIPMNPGYQIVDINNGERGYFATGTTVGASFSIGVYNTFTSFSGDVASFAGNGCTSFTVRYVGN